MDNKKLQSMFSRNVENTPMNDYPVNNMQKILNFNDMCYNTSSEFVDGYGPDSVLNSKGGRWCKKVVREMLPYVGKIPDQYNVATPIIRVRPKWFRASLDSCKGNPEAALAQCVKTAEAEGSDPEYCESAYTMYKQVYEDKMPPLPQPYKEDFNKEGSIKTTGRHVEQIRVPPRVKFPEKITIQDDSDTRALALIARYLLFGLVLTLIIAISCTLV